MADPLQKLMPPIAPPMPEPVAHPHAIDAGLLAVAALLFAAVAAWAFRKFGIPAWRHRRLRRELDALPAGADVSAMAQELVGLVRKYRLQPAQAWWQAADALRFQRPAQVEREGQCALAELKRQVACMEHRRD